MARLQEYYRSTVVQQLMQQFGYKSVMEVPRIRENHAQYGCGRGGRR